ncbi:hypothetical protein [Corynebacterium sp. 20_84]
MNEEELQQRMNKLAEQIAASSEEDKNSYMRETAEWDRAYDWWGYGAL